MRLQLLTAAIAVLASLGFSDEAPIILGTAVTRSHMSTAPDGTAGAETIELHPDLPRALLRLERHRSARIDRWPLAPAVRASVVLTRQEIYAPDARLVVIRNGRTTEVPRSRLQFFVGRSDTDSFTRVLAWVDPDTQVMRSITQSVSGTYEMLAPSRKGGSQVLARTETLRDKDGVLPDGTCGNEALEPLRQSRLSGASGGGPDVESASGAGAGTDGFSSTQTLVVAFDTDKEVMSLKFANNPTTAANYIASLMAAINIMYERDINIQLLIGTTMFRIGSDPYVTNCNGNACGTALSEFSSYWKANYPSVTRGLAAMLSGRQPDAPGGGAYFSGIAWIQGLCSQDYGYSYNQTFKNTLAFVSTEAKFIGHELGHNFGARHTHCNQQDLGTPIDSCYNGESGCYSGPETCPLQGTYQGFTTPAGALGTVMSYCHLLSGCGSSPVFHSRTITSIWPYVSNAANTCIQPLAGVNILSINNVTAYEGDSGTQVFAFTVTRAGDSGSSTVQYATANNTATSGSDYVATSGTLSFAAGEESKTISVTVNGDLTVEPDETFFVNLSNPVNATIGTAQGVGTIRNDDGPRLSLERTTLRFGAVNGGGGTLTLVTPSQTIALSVAPGTAWTASSNKAYITVSPASGSGSGVLTIQAVSNASLPASGAALPATITVTAPAAINSPLTIAVNLQLYAPGTTAVPFGSFDTPINGTTGVQGAIGVTGWALDDIGISKVELWRDRVNGDPPPAPNGKIYIGNATFVNGARPDVDGLYPTYPQSYRAAWGYALLTNLLPTVSSGAPAGGIGTFTLYAYLTDIEGNVTLLPSRTFTASNNLANKPFGTIDTPTQGQTVSGTIDNWGWVLTPLPATMPTDGSTIRLYIDSAPLGTAQYNLPRSDIQTLFPGYNNTNGAIGRFVIDTTTLANGVHTIAWSATDNQSRADGIGSRYFTVQN